MFFMTWELENLDGENVQYQNQQFPKKLILSLMTS